jgi:hypothetical protein
MILWARRKERLCPLRLLQSETEGDSEMYEELKTWQTGLGALLGFVALMSAALWNFHLNRRRDKRLQLEETKSVAAAFYGEIILLRSEVAILAKIVARFEARMDRQSIDSHFVKSHALSEPILYPALASKIGVLSSQLVLAITEFHRNFRLVKSALPFLVDVPERGYRFSSLILLQPAFDAVRNVTPALGAIERLCAIEPPNQSPDLGLTEQIIQHEIEDPGTKIRPGEIE